MPSDAPANHESTRMWLNLYLPTLRPSVAWTFEHRRRQRIAAARVHVVHTREASDSMLVPRVMASRAVDHGPGNRGRGADQLADRLAKLLHRRIGPREEVFTRLPPSDVERSGPASAIALHSAQDDLSQLYAELWADVIKNDRLVTAIRYELLQDISRHGGCVNHVVVISCGEARRYDAPISSFEEGSSTAGIPAFVRISSAMSTATVAMSDGEAIESLGAIMRPAAIDPATRARSSLRASIGPEA